MWARRTVPVVPEPSALPPLDEREGETQRPSDAAESAERIRAEPFYAEYYGHKIEDLRSLHALLRGQGCQDFVWLAGDSSLDNKNWLAQRDVLDNAVPALNGYESALSPPQMLPDVSYWVNHSLDAARKDGAPLVCAINAAKEESTLGERVGAGGRLNAHDEFLRDHISDRDVLIVDVGGNDIALKPTFWTGLNIAALLYLSCTPLIKYCSFALAPCPGVYFGFPFGLGYFVNMFRHKTKEYIEKLIEKRNPRKVIVCMLYYLDEMPGLGWCDDVLQMLGYNKNPAKLQAVIKRVFELGTSRIQLQGTEVVPFPLFVPLDGKTSADYVERVEPSAQGGRKMAEALLPAILEL